QSASPLVFWKTQWPVPLFGFTETSTASSVVAAVAWPKWDTRPFAVMSRCRIGWNGSGGNDGKGGSTRIEVANSPVMLEERPSHGLDPGLSTFPFVTDVVAAVSTARMGLVVMRVVAQPSANPRLLNMLTLFI